MLLRAALHLSLSEGCLSDALSPLVAHSYLLSFSFTSHSTTTILLLAALVTNRRC